jgi:nucleoside recognition membrane protein YjiH
MKLDTIIRSFLIAGLISILAFLLESAYYGLSNEVYSITSPFVSIINSPLNMAVLAVIFISTFLVVLNKIHKKERA